MAIDRENRRYRFVRELWLRQIRLARAVHVLLPDKPEVAGLLALMLLTDARRAARTGVDGELIPHGARSKLVKAG